MVMVSHLSSTALMQVAGIKEKEVLSYSGPYHLAGLKKTITQR